MKKLTREFADALASVNRPGDFSMSGIIELSAPGLMVEGVGRVALPLLPDQAARLVAVATAAPFGRGEATIVDRTVRRTWQIAPQKVQITGRHWPACLDRIVAKAAVGLGVEGPVEAQFYKLLVYDEGSFFVGHRDTEKAPGMFATLVIVLPSDGGGGELIVRHQGREARLDLRVEDPGEAAFAAFYADCVHEVLPVTCGHRLTLVYNLVRSGARGGLQPPSYDGEVAKLVALLRNWPATDDPAVDVASRAAPVAAAAHGEEDEEDADGEDADEEDLEDEDLEDEDFDEDDEDKFSHDEDDDEDHFVTDVSGSKREIGFEKLVYPLEHAYTPAELSFAALKGADAAAAGVLTAAAAQAGFEINLALLVIEQDGAAEEIYRGRSSRRRSRYDDDDTEFKVAEIYETQRTLSDWKRPDGAPSSLGRIPFLEQELSPPDAFADMEPDESHFREATGNEGATFERTYRRAALVVWPRARINAVLSQAGLEATMPALEGMVQSAKAGGAKDNAARRATASDLAGHMLTNWPRHPPLPGSKQAAYPTTFLRLLGDLDDAKLIRRFLAEVATGAACQQENNAAILDAVDRLPRQDRADVVARIVAARAKRASAICAGLLAAAVRRAKARAGDLVEAATALVADLPGNPETAEWRRPPAVEPGFVADLMDALPVIAEAQAAKAVDHMVRWPRSYRLDEVIVPGLLKGAASRGAAASPSVKRLRAVALAHLDERIAEPLAEPADFRRDAALDCKCKDCAAVAMFLADPVQKSWMLRAPQHARTHVEEIVKRATADVDARTERKGSPHTLVLTKNQASYERRSKQRASDLASRAALGA